MELSGIYEDLNDLPIGDKLIQAQEKNKKLLQHIEFLKNDISKLCKELTQMKGRESNLKKNISELFNTATNEMNRKQKMINDLQNKLDEVRFKRGSSNFSYNNYKRNRVDDIEVIAPKKVKTDFDHSRKRSNDDNEIIASKVVTSEDSNKTDDDVEIIETKVQSDSSNKDKFDKKSLHFSRESSKDRYKSSNRHNSPHRERYNKSHLHFSREPIMDKHTSKSRHRSRESHRHSNSHSKSDDKEHLSKNHRVRINNYCNAELKIEVKNNERVINVVNKNQKVPDHNRKAEKFTKNENSAKKAIDEIHRPSQNDKKTTDTTNIKESKSSEFSDTIKNAKKTAKSVTIKSNDSKRKQEEIKTTPKNINSEEITTITNKDKEENASTKHVNQELEKDIATDIKMTSDEIKKEINKTNSDVPEAILINIKSDNLHPIKTESECTSKQIKNEENKSIKVELSTPSKESDIKIDESLSLKIEPDYNTTNVKVEVKKEEILDEDHISNGSEQTNEILEVNVLTDSALNVNLNRRRRCVMKIVNK